MEGELHPMYVGLLVGPYRYSMSTFNNILIQAHSADTPHVSGRFWQAISTHAKIARRSQSSSGGTSCKDACDDACRGHFTECFFGLLPGLFVILVQLLSSSPSCSARLSVSTRPSHPRLGL
jgi:hypothetical protein